MRLLLILLWALAAAAALAGCGDAEEDAVRGTIDAAYTSTEPSACTAHRTPAFAAQGSFGLAGVARDYERYCAANIAALAADEVRISAVKVSGDRALATFSARGGAYPVKEARVALRRGGGRWRLDELVAISLDRADFDRLQLRVASEAAGALPRDRAACLVRRLRRVATDRLERATVAADPSVLADPVLICVVRPDIRAAGYSLAQTRCVILRIRRELAADAFVRLLLTRTPAAQARLKREFARAGTACAR